MAVWVKTHPAPQELAVQFPPASGLLQGPHWTGQEEDEEAEDEGLDEGEELEQGDELLELKELAEEQLTGVQNGFHHGQGDSLQDDADDFDDADGTEEGCEPAEPDEQDSGVHQKAHQGQSTGLQAEDAEADEHDSGVHEKSHHGQSVGLQAEPEEGPDDFEEEAGHPPLGQQLQSVPLN